MLEAERGEVDLVDGLVDLAADARGEELRLWEAEQRCYGCCIAQEVELERLVGGVAPRAGEPCCGGELAIVGRVVKVGLVAVRSGSDRAPVEEVVEDVGGVRVGDKPRGKGHVERLAAPSGEVADGDARERLDLDADPDRRKLGFDELGQLAVGGLDRGVEDGASSMAARK